MKALCTRRYRLTSYGLACGYIEKFKVAAREMRLWREHNCYHVRAHDHESGTRIMWETFDTLTPARKCFDKSKKLVG